VSTMTKRRKTAPKIGKEAWQVVDPAGHVLAVRDGKTHTDGAALSLAQKIAEKNDGEIELSVQLVPLFGDPDPHYRVVKNEDGIVLSYRV
jgi:hypothetical protein